MKTEFTNLKEMLEKLQTEGGHGIEYGDPKQPGGPFTGIRIKYMNTAGGPQFRICECSRGMEGSGFYYPDAENTAHNALILKNKYTKPSPHPLIQKMLADRQRRDLSWFFLNNEPQFNRPINPLLEQEGTETIELKA